jgi:predicted O-methyltransferase YrrM
LVYSGVIPDDVVDKVLDNFFDVVFIDGLHTYEQLTKDCANYYSKLKEGGVFARTRLSCLHS